MPSIVIYNPAQADSDKRLEYNRGAEKQDITRLVIFHGNTIILQI